VALARLVLTNNPIVISQEPERQTRA